ncbi:phage minor tail protein L [Photobacterium sp. 1_MG-2023]|uniref:phage minor tail protein L n=1 Tax=Photobacterium sp. 1_MG-2023 TaxID=3062646 RepID=UPI0026E13E1E|nr:phage minor tail protein L [Photobacterium sp. 1_MG-2023]MDO6706795.1 phage minor tail protein L [Photobacterium sp. 1_MG-2023]
MNLPADMLAESIKLTQPPLLDLYDIDLTPFGGDMLRLHNGLNAKREPLVWRGHIYQPYPIEGSGFEMSGRGPSNRPKLSVSNLLGLVTGMVADFQELTGAIVTRRQMYLKHLDAVNFEGGNQFADETQERVSRYMIERLTNLTHLTATFELSLPSEMQGAIIPARIITTDVCPWQYRSADCSYAGGPVAKHDDTPTSDPTQDQCGKRLGSCRLRFGQNGVLPFGGFPTAVRIKR